MPVAVNCCVVPSAIDGFVGVMPIETSVAGVTVSAVEPLTGPETALMVVVPAATLVARPFEPEALLSVAADVSEDAHVADAVKSWVELSV